MENKKRIYLNVPVTKEEKEAFMELAKIKRRPLAQIVREYLRRTAASNGVKM